MFEACRFSLNTFLSSSVKSTKLCDSSYSTVKTTSSTEAMKVKPAGRMSTRASVKSDIDDKPRAKTSARRNNPLKASPHNDESKKNDQQMAMYSKIVQLAKLRAGNGQPPRIKRKVKRAPRKNGTNQSKNTSSTDDETLTTDGNATNQRNITKTPSRVMVLHPGTSNAREKHWFRCHTCRYQSRQRSKVIRHMKVHEKRFRCDICERAFYEQDVLDLHKANHKNQCLNCLRRLSSELEFQEHVNKCKYQRKRFQCCLCKIYVRSDYNLNEHMKKFH